MPLCLYISRVGSAAGYHVWVCVGYNYSCQGSRVNLQGAAGQGLCLQCLQLLKNTAMKLFI